MTGKKKFDFITKILLLMTNSEKLKEMCYTIN